MHDCAACGRGFTRKHSLKAHTLRVHEKQRSHICDDCNKGFATAYDLTRHKNRKHRLFEVIENGEQKTKPLRYCDATVTFRLQPNTDSSHDWLYKVFGGILKYFNNKYKPSEDDLVGMTIYNENFPSKEGYVSMRKSKEMDVKTIIDKLDIISQSNTQFNVAGDLTVCYKHIKVNKPE